MSLITRNVPFKRMNISLPSIRKASGNFPLAIASSWASICLTRDKLLVLKIPYGWAFKELLFGTSFFVCVLFFF